MQDKINQSVVELNEEKRGEEKRSMLGNKYIRYCHVTQIRDSQWFRIKTNHTTS